jgi:8-oxo-dGTP pyrophosphatase MutT (NUDIX family)
MSPIRPDLVECFVFRVPEGAAQPELLLIRRAPGRIFSGLWQPVTGGIAANESVPACARREVREEVGFESADIVGFYDLDQTTQFYDEGADAVVSAVIFAARVRPDAEPTLSHEHDAYRWVEPAEAGRLAIWPTYRESMERIVTKLLDPDLARWFALDAEGRRVAR